MARRASLTGSQPTQLTTRSITQAVALLDNLEQQRHEKRARYSAVRADDLDNEPDSNSPVFDAFLASQGTEGIMTMTNFSPSEFNVLWADVRQYVLRHWNVGSGRKSEVSGRDLLFMTLTALKHCGTWDVVAAVFKQKPPTFEKRVMTYVAALHPFLFRNYVTAIADKWSMLELIAAGSRFKNFPAALYATDVTFQQTNVPAGSFAEKKLFYSGKHSLYGHKVEVSVLPNGFAINCTAFYKGSASDKTIFDENRDFHVGCLTKRTGEEHVADLEGGGGAHGDVQQWAVLADKGYQGIQRDVRAIIPVKKPMGGALSSDELRKNDRIASDRVVVENFFGRLKTLWAVCSDTYRWSRKNYDLMFQTCVALTNVHVRLHPLRAEDGDANTQYVNRLSAIGAKIIKTKKVAARTYRAKRKTRLSLIMASESSLGADAAGSDTDMGSNYDSDGGRSSRLFL